MTGPEHRRAGELAAEARRLPGRGDGRATAGVWAAVAQTRAMLALAAAQTRAMLALAAATAATAAGASGADHRAWAGAAGTGSGSGRGDH